MDVIIRKAETTLEDMGRIRSIDAVTFGACSYDLEAMLQVVKTGAQVVFLAESLGQTVGFLSLMKVQTLHYHAYWIDLVAVLPECQSRGIGQKLIDHAVDYVGEHGGQFVSALVRQSNKGSLRSFDKAGFNNEGSFNLFTKT